jgi:diguanylate cyclase (GGDEF)-like protein
MSRFQKKSLRSKIIFWTGCLTTVVFVVIIIFISASFKKSLEKGIYADVATKNTGYAHTIHSIFKDKADTILALRDDLELYDTLGQMWVHIAAHAGEKIFRDPVHAGAYIESFQKKLEAYKNNGQLSPDKLTSQIQKMLDNIGTTKNAYGDGIKFFYIGIPVQNSDKTLEGYDRYQDSSLWVPDPEVDELYNPLTRPWYLAGQEAGRGNVLFTEPYAERRTKEALTSGGTVIDINGVRGTFAAAISIKPVMDALLRTFHENSHITIFSKGVEKATAYVAVSPKYIYSSRDASLGESFSAYNDKEIIKNPLNRDVMHLYEATRSSQSGVLAWVINGEERIVAYDTVPGVGWKIFSSVSKKERMAEAITAQYEIIIIASIGVIALLFIISLTVSRALLPVGQIGRELKEIADTGDLNKRTTVITEDEIGQIAKAINEMLDNTAGPVKELGDKVQKIAQGDRANEIVVKAKGDIANLVASFNQMASRLIEFEATFRDASPLTGLPGGVTIENVVQGRINAKIPFAFCMFDLDNFKPFNDRYGYSRGNLVIKHTARVIQEAVKAHGNHDDFIGHIGGDDFVVVSTPDRFRAVCEAVMERFDSTIIDYYDEADRQAGFIASKDRRGEAMVFSIMTLSICAVDSESIQLNDYIRVGELAAEMKCYAKAKAIKGSKFVVNQRMA